MTTRLAASATEVDKKSEMNFQDSRCARHCAIRTRRDGIENAVTVSRRKPERFLAEIRRETLMTMT
jgi:hypothetical protein